MKKIFCILMALGVVAAVGCAKQEPEDAAKTLVEKQIATKHQGFVFDTSDLDYEVVEEGDDFARVIVSGEIEVKGEIALVKKGQEWVPGQPPAPAEKSKAPADRSVPAVVQTSEKSASAEGRH
jgi:hypothetical protein